MFVTVLRLADGPLSEGGPLVAVASAGLACCGLEVDSAISAGYLVPVESKLADVDVLLVAGTITEAMRAPLLAMLESMRPDVRIVAFGACATSGGPYWDAPMVVPGFDELGLDRTVACYVPGCPPSPTALVTALRELATVSP